MEPYILTRVTMSDSLAESQQRGTGGVRRSILANLLLRLIRILTKRRYLRTPEILLRGFP